MMFVLLVPDSFVCSCIFIHAATLVYTLVYHNSVKDTRILRLHLKGPLLSCIMIPWESCRPCGLFSRHRGPCPYIKPLLNPILNKKEKIMELVFNIIKGIMIGIANVIPGVSGGTMAVSFGIYDADQQYFRLHKACEGKPGPAVPPFFWAASWASPASPTPSNICWKTIPSSPA